jgi:hypothetical protein
VTAGRGAPFDRFEEVVASTKWRELRMSELVKGLLLEGKPSGLDPGWTMAITILAAVALIGEAISGFSKVRDLLVQWELLRPLRLVGAVSIVIVVLAALHQYRNVAWASDMAEHKAQREFERRFAAVLYAFMEPETGLLRMIAKDQSAAQYERSKDERVAEYEHFILGYQSFKHGDWGKAKDEFNKAKEKHKFEAESDYILAVISTHKRDQCLDFDVDWSDGENDLRDAISRDPDYLAPYYLLAVLELDGTPPKKKLALDDLRRAVKGKDGIPSCYDINDKFEINNMLSSLKDDPDFQELQQDCLSEGKLKLQASSTGAKACAGKKKAHR